MQAKTYGGPKRNYRESRERENKGPDQNDISS